MPTDRTATKIPLCIPFLGIARGLSPNFHIYVFVGNLQDRSTYFLQQNRQMNRGKIYIALRHMILEIGAVAVQFLFWEYLFQILVLALCNALMDAQLESSA